MYAVISGHNTPIPHYILWVKCHFSGCLDVAIIGAGFSGSYAAWKMRDLGLNIHVYEMSDHVGGMFHTMHLPEYPDLDLELGVTSYNPEVVNWSHGALINFLINWVYWLILCFIFFAATNTAANWLDVFYLWNQDQTLINWL